MRCYRLLPRRVSAAQTQMDRLVSTLWDRIFPGQLFGQDHRLDQVFPRTLHQSELLTQNICPYYFDQVAWSLPAASLRQDNLQLHHFESWADLEKERHRRRLTNPGSRPDSGVYLSRLCYLQDLQCEGSMTTETFIRLMYGYSG